MQPTPHDTLKHLEPILGKHKTTALWRYYLSQGTPFDRQAAAGLIELLAERNLPSRYQQTPVLPPPDPSKCTGDYPLGRVLYQNKPYAPFGLREEEWLRHVLIVGMSGTGKTNLAFHLLGQFQKKGKPFLVFDWKRNYRDLLRLPGFEDLHVFTIGSTVAPLQFNPLIPPAGVPPRQWLAKLADVISHAYFTGHGVEFLLREALDTVYDQFGVYTGNQKRYPTFEDVWEELKKVKAYGREGLWMASAKRVLAALTFSGGLGPVLNSPTQGPLAQLLEQPVVLELDGLSDHDKVFFTEALLLWIYEARKREPSREVFKHALLIEEGHHILSSRKERHEGAETIMETLLRQIREFGEAVLVLDQEPAKLSESVKANTATKIVFNLGNGKDILDIARSLHLDRFQEASINPLPVGQAVVGVKGRLPEPVLVAWPLVKVDKGSVSNTELRKKWGQNRRGVPP
ncbi:MAG: ATP-binding protein [Candidatus Tectomicrobia bacterium]|nr:ATP-binding protein [Candidatus Tectomicrobia bacterium]